MGKALPAVLVLTLLLVAGVTFSTPLSGVYTIDEGSPGYISFAAAVNDLNTLGISGPVTFNVRAGTYNESFQINTISGASAINTVTFQSATGVASSVTIVSNIPNGDGIVGDSGTVIMNGSLYVTFNNLTINSSYTNAVLIEGGSGYISITNCILNCPLSQAYQDTYVIYSTTGTNNNILITGCRVTGASDGYVAGGAGTPNNGPTVTNNTWINQSSEAIYLYSCDSPLIQGNTISTDIHSAPYGIYVYAYNSNVMILANKIRSNSTELSYEYGLYLHGGNSVGLVANNFIEGNDYGILADNLTNYSFYNNSFSANQYIIYLTTGSHGNVLTNNIFYSPTGGGMFYLDATSDFSASDYNDFYTTGTFTASYANLTAWQSGTGFDAHSHSTFPPFVSDTDYHLTACDSLRFGIPLVLVPYDIDTDLRSLATIVVGAYECPIPLPVVQFTADTANICAGLAVTFTDQSSNSPVSWNWTFDGGIPNTSDSENPVIYYDTAGTYNVKLAVTNSSGTDSLIKTGYVIVNILPNAGVVIANRDSVCSGSASQLTVSGSAGNIQWQSSGDDILFTGIPGAQSDTFNALTLTQTTYYRVNVSSLCGVDSSAAAMVFVTPLPVTGTPSAQPDTLCSGSPAQITSTGVSGNVIQWQSSIAGSNYSNINDADSAVYSTAALNQSTVYRLIVSNGSCSDTSAAISVLVNPSPPPPVLSTNDSIICSSDSTLIQASSGYATYQWNDGDTSRTTKVHQAGDYWVTVTNISGCQIISDHQRISVFSVSSVSIVVQGDTLSSGKAKSYQWFFGDSIIPGANDDIYVANKSGDFAVQITDTNGCKELSNNTPVSINRISVLDGNSGLNIYPDPFTNAIFITSNKESFHIESVDVFNVLGEKISSRIYINIESGTISVDASTFSPGIYFVLVNTGNQSYLKKIMKE